MYPRLLQHNYRRSFSLTSNLTVPGRLKVYTDAAAATAVATAAAAAAISRVMMQATARL